jgi:signal transduction histidine kinase/ligand-binding sensor domain-containing protein/DNA-binding response OmpR family regulator
MHRFRFLLLLLFALFFTDGVSAREYHFRHIKIEDGLSSNTVFDMVQDRAGFIWFATQYGLDCYDGLSIRPMLKNLSADRLLVDHQGNLWVSTTLGVLRYDVSLDRFIPLEVAKGNPRLPLQGAITCMIEDKTGHLWFSTYNSGIYCYNSETHTMTHFGPAQGANGARAIFCDSENNIWIAARYSVSPLMRLNKARNVFQPFLLSGNLGNVMGMALFEDSNHTLWMGTWDTGLISVNRFSGQTHTYELPGGKGGAHHIHYISEPEPGAIYIGSDDGLVRLELATGKTFLFPQNGTSYDLSNAFVYPIVRDREGGIWVGTYYGGVNYLSPSDGQFESYNHTPRGNSINGITIARFCEDAAGMIWIASDDGGLSCLDPHTGIFHNYPNESGPMSLSYHNAHALCAADGDVWVGTYGGGLNRLHVASGRFTVYSSSTPPPLRLNDNSIYALYRQPDGNLWIGTMRGVDLFDTKHNVVRTVKILDALIIDIDADTKGNLWFSTSGKGIWRYQQHTGRWQCYSTARCGIPSAEINAALCDRNGTVWVATSKGLCRYDAAKNCFTAVALNIPNQNIMGIIEDGDNLWLTTAKGLVRFTPSSRESIVFTTNNGLLCDQFVQNSALMASDGKIYVGTVEGFNAFYPHNIQPNEKIPPVVFTGIEIDNEPVYASPDGPLKVGIRKAERIDVGAKNNVLSISFASLSFPSPENNRYVYKLDGFDKGWVQTTGVGKATYTNLPPGTYTFRVRAANNDGVWNNVGASIKVVVHPPFYWSIWAKMFYLLLIIGGIYYYMRRSRIKTERRHAYRLQMLTQEKEKEVYASKIQFFTTIAHEIRTPVSLIIGPLEKIMGAKDLSNAVRTDLSVVQRNSQRLLNLVNQLLDFRKVEQGGLKIQFRNNDLVPIVRSVADRFKPWIEQRGHQFTVALPDRSFEVCCDAEAITKVISNLLTNASKYTKTFVRLECRLLDDAQHFTLTVTDDGPGISEAEKQKIFRPFYQAEQNQPGTGIGLSIVQHIVERHHGKIDLTSELGKGSSFCVTLPVHQPGMEEESQSAPEEKRPVDILSDKRTEEVPSAEVSPHKVKKDEKPTMLIVDDNEDMLAFLSSNFVDEYCILTAEDGRKALDILDHHTVTIIISDWMMPVMDGPEFCRTVRQNQATSHIPFILLTAKTDVDSKIEGMDVGADAYIEKPFSVAYLKSCIHNLLALRTMLRQKFSQMPAVSIDTLTQNPTDRKFLEQINSIIEDNFSNNELSVDFLADKMCISRSGLFVKVRSLTDFTPNELIQVVRLKKAAELLQEHKYRMNEVCYKVGFNNPSYFAKCFYKQFGVRPSEYGTESSVE